MNVTLGINDGTNVEIKNGLKSGDIVEVPSVTATTTAGFSAMRQSTSQKSSTAGVSTGGGSKWTEIS